MGRCLLPKTVRPQRQQPRLEPIGSRSWAAREDRGTCPLGYGRRARASSSPSPTHRASAPPLAAASLALPSRHSTSGTQDRVLGSPEPGQSCTEGSPCAHGRDEALGGFRGPVLTKTCHPHRPPRVLQTLGKTPSLASLNPPPHTFFLPPASQGLLGNDLPRTPQARNRFHAPCPEISGFSAPDSRVGWQRGTWLASGNLPACCSQPQACGPLLSPAHYWAWHAGVTSPGYPLRIRSTPVLDLPPIPHHPSAAAPLLSVFLPGL